jgi:hypothetical protein
MNIYKNHSSKPRAFFGVSIFIILSGAGLLATALTRFLLAWNGQLVGPAHLLDLVVSGLIVTALGYILLELELIRTR